MKMWFGRSSAAVSAPGCPPRTPAPGAGDLLACRWLLGLGAGLALFACRAETGDELPSHYRDPSNASRLTLSAPPARIVSLAPNLTELLFALGAGPRVVGVTRYCDEPAAAKTRTRVGGFVDLDFETVLSLRPDLVVAVKNSQNRDFVRRLEEAGVRVYWTALVSEEDVFRVTSELAALLGRGAAGDELRSTVREALSDVERRVAGAPGRRVLLVFGYRPLVVAGPGTFADALIRRAGGRNVAAGSLMSYPSWSVEEVVRAAPDVIIDAYMGTGAEGDAGALWSDLTSIPAVRHGRIGRLQTSAILRPGPRLPEALDAVARLIHPERFPEATTDGRPR